MFDTRHAAKTIGRLLFMTILICAALSRPALSQEWADGPYERLVIRNAILIDGSGAPPQGPMDIAIENDRITQIRNIGAPGIPPKDCLLYTSDAADE